MSIADALVVFTPSGKRGRVPIGTPVLEAARQLGVDLDSVCGGRGICSKCQITPEFGDFPKHGLTSQPGSLSPWNAVEARYDDKRGLITGRRLGCQAKIEGDVIIDVPPESQVHAQVVRKSADTRPVALDQATRLVTVEVVEPDMHAPSGDAERLIDAVRASTGVSTMTLHPHALRRLQTALRKGDWRVTAAVHQADAGGAAQILDLWPGVPDHSLYGLAIDLGSTTIAAHLCDLRTGDVIASAGVMNPQIRFGEDLMSRVSYVMMNDGGDMAMTGAVRAAMNDLAKSLANTAQIDPGTILETTVVCNPVMHHLFLGFDPTELGQAPFALVTGDALTWPAEALDLNAIHPAAQVYMLPLIAGHVGADAAAVALAERPDQSDPLTLIVDVGTNAEILLGNQNGVLACSSPTGPAFEGAQISSGQRAAPGAIERVRIDPDTKVARFRVIGSELWSDEDGFAEATAQSGITGICGSGIIEAVAEMRKVGIIDPSGLIGSSEATRSAQITAEGRTFSYTLYDDSASGGPHISVTQGDVRAIQLAKSALYAGARLLMDELGVDHVDQVTLAGAFGAHISPEHAMVLGMIPDCPLDKVRSAGNAAGHGARVALMSRSARRDVERLVQQITKVETAVAPKFQEHFVNANALPHATDPFDGLRRTVPLPEVNHNQGSDRPRRRRRAS